ncbi:hypothetical protein [uncultured Roseibium sp.]|uniref:hypothetical protein n=1 Tax=uncultured Roseibium sp. TaxID=1936171 RepID=UPI002605514E|nr:hypothetical protein [uncultured Roseibium sp.]
MTENTNGQYERKKHVINARQPSLDLEYYYPYRATVANYQLQLSTIMGSAPRPSTYEFIPFVPLLSIFLGFDTERLFEFLKTQQWVLEFKQSTVDIVSEMVSQAHELSNCFPGFGLWVLGYRSQRNAKQIELLLAPPRTSFSDMLRPKLLNLTAVPLLICALNVTNQVWFWSFEEPAYELSNLGFDILVVCYCLQVMFCSRTTLAACILFWVNFASAYPVLWSLYLPVSQFEKLKYLYSENWYTFLSVGLVLTSVIGVQLSRFWMNFFMWVFSPIKRLSIPSNGQHQSLQKFFRKALSFQCQYLMWKTVVNRYNVNFVCNMILGIIACNAEWQIACNNRRLPEELASSMRQARKELQADHTQSAKFNHYAKMIYGTVYFVLVVTVLVILVARNQRATYISFIGSVFIFTILVSVRVFTSGVSIINLVEFAQAVIGQSIVTLAIVAIPVWRNPTLYNDRNKAWIVGLVATTVVYTVLIAVPTYLIIQFAKWLAGRSAKASRNQTIVSDTPGDQPV